MYHKTTLYIIRHGETKWNRLGKIHGQKNSPLTQKGQNQAQALALALKKHHPDLIYTSDLGRAAQTATIIGNLLGKKVHPTKFLRERSFGLFEGQIWEQLKTNDPQFYQDYSQNPFLYQYPQGESYQDVHNRLIPWLKHQLLSWRGKKAVLVTHHGILRTLAVFLNIVPPDKIRDIEVENTSITTIEYDHLTKNFLTHAFANTSHL